MTKSSAGSTIPAFDYKKPAYSILWMPEGKFEEDSNGFTYCICRPEEVISRLKAFNAPAHWFAVALWFPKNYDFITLANPMTLGRLRKCGLTSDGLVVLEVAAVISYSRGLEPALAANHIILMKDRHEYLRTLVVNRQYVLDSEDIELEDTVLHESLHLAEDEPKIRSGRAAREGEEYREIEARIDSLVKKRLGPKYGRRLDAADARSLLYAYDMQSRAKTISSGTLEYWLHRFVFDHWDQLQSYAIGMTPQMEGGGYVKVVTQDMAVVKQTYFEWFGYRLPDIE